MLAALLLLCSMPLAAQRVRVVDADGDGIALAAVRTSSGVLLGTTDLNGVLEDVKGHQTIYVSHLAYNPRTINVSDLKDGLITMEEREYDFAEAEVKSKEYFYTEVYYRFYGYVNDSLRCYRAGIVPCAYDLKKKKITEKFGFYSYALFNLKDVTWWEVRSADMIRGGIRGTPGETLLENGSWKKRYFLEKIPDGKDRWKIVNPRDTVGTLVRENGFSMITMDAGRAQMYANEQYGEDRLLKRRQDKDYTYSYSEVYRIGEDGGVRHNDFVMSLNHWEHNGSKGRETYIVETTVTGTAYMTKDEFKQKRKELDALNSTENMFHMPLSDLEAYERSHNIPVMTDEVRRAVEKITRDRWK
ncbi:MAG: hypothetical protein IJ722_04785 [Alloprevotella sp.]|nr:hypothetical protein [Alloprevotella sp.]